MIQQELDKLTPAQQPSGDTTQDSTTTREVVDLCGSSDGEGETAVQDTRAATSNAPDVVVTADPPQKTESAPLVALSDAAKAVSVVDRRGRPITAVEDAGVHTDDPDALQLDYRHWKR